MLKLNTVAVTLRSMSRRIRRPFSRARLVTGHFALEEDCDAIAGYMGAFLDKNVKRTRVAASSK